MKTVKINNVSVRVFEKKELSEKLRLSDEEIKLVMDYQKTFPELLQDGVDGFVIDARNLWNQLDNPQGEFSKWAKRKVVDKYFEENKDYIKVDNFVDVGNLKRPQIDYALTIDTAKNVSMMEKSDKGKLIRTYFITMEKTLRNYEKWIEVREPQKAGNNEMKHLVNEDYKESHGGESSPFYVFCTENDMLNLALLGMKAKEVKAILDYDDKLTREHFTTDINKALSELQLINSSLIISKMNFQQRKEVIRKTCNSKYKGIKDEFNEYIAKINKSVI